MLCGGLSASLDVEECSRLSSTPELAQHSLPVFRSQTLRSVQ